MPRGRLVFPFLIEIAPLDTAATAADPDGGGELESGYDPIFRAPKKILADPADQTGASGRVEGAVYTMPAQVEPEFFQRLEMLLAGDNPDGMMRLVFHFRDLENAGRVDANGLATIRKGDRINRILTKRGELVQVIPNPPGLFVTEALPRGMGLSLGNPKRNLLLVTVQEREQSSRTG